MSRRTLSTSLFHRVVNRWVRLLRQLFSLIIGIFLVGLLAALLRRWLARRKPVSAPSVPPLEIPIEVIPAPALPVAEIPAPPQVLPLPLGEPGAPPEVMIGVPEEEAEVSFEFPGAPAVPLIPDVYVPLPPGILVESDLEIVTADGKILRYQFNWQNPNLRAEIYPFRVEKLRDFLLYFSEIDLVQDFKAKGESDPSVQAHMEQSKAAMQARRQQVEDALNAGIDKKINVQKDTWFARISASSLKSLRFRQSYYINQEVSRLQDKLDDLQNQKTSLVKRLAWWPTRLDKQQEIQNQIAALDGQIKAIQDQLTLPLELQDLLQKEDELPGDEVTLQDILHWEMRQKEEQWSVLDQDGLLKEIILWINRQPDRFPEWLIYMVIHFSGMRYMSAHSSWASPRDLLEMFKHEDIADEVKALSGNDLIQACQAAVQRLTSLPAPTDPLKKVDLDRLIQGLKISDKNALLEASTDELADNMQNLRDDNACLQALIQYRQQLNAEAVANNNPDIAMPPWVWAEICKYTPLRLQTNDPNWDAVSPQRSNWIYNQWRLVLASWEKTDVTAWRQKHHDSLDLVVTRSVCNELAEQIQNLRGLTPAAGLTARPIWYIRQQAQYPTAYLVQAPDESDFVPGASILWLEWVDTQPNAWQVAQAMQGYVMAPVDTQIKLQPGQKKEVSRKALELQKLDTGGWDYQVQGNTYSRTSPLPAPDELRKQGKSDKEIADIMAQRKINGNTAIQYLRWSHEATIVGVFDLIDGRSVMTFETGPIGLQFRSLRSLVGNANIFVGYVPDANLDPDRDNDLVNMLRWDRILPTIPLPPRTRPKKIIPKPVDSGGGIPTLPPISVPQRPAIVIRQDSKCFKITARDDRQRPTMARVAPFIILDVGTELSVSANRAESQFDGSDGIVNTVNGKFLYVIDCPDNSLAEGNYVRLEEVADASGGKWLTINPQTERAMCNIFKGYDDKGKPILQPDENIGRRVLLQTGIKFRVSTTHTESDKDPGDGTIVGTSSEEFYLILECPVMPQAEGLYIPKLLVINTSEP